MTQRVFLNGRVTLFAGDCLAVLPTLPTDSVDSVVTDPPYHLHSIVKRFAKTGRTESTRTQSGPHQRTATGFMGKKWDGGDVAFLPETWAEVLRVLKPGGYILAFSSCRTFGRMSVAIEDAGFITHPFVAWIFGSGFPKAHNASKAIDRELGAQREKVKMPNPPAWQRSVGNTRPWMEDRDHKVDSDMPITPAAAQWNGWAYGGQALKPAIEPIYMGQKPFSEKNGAANILKHGTGAINIDGCRVASNGEDRSARYGGKPSLGGNGSVAYAGRMDEVWQAPDGRWPANLILDGSDEVVEAFPDAPGQQYSTGPQYDRKAEVYGKFAGVTAHEPRNDTGSAARFFYSSKADADDRLGSKHPTVKPLDLMQYLVRLITPPKGIVLDPFAGTGTTAEAAWREGFSAVLIERETEYQADIERRMALCLAGPDERARESIKARLKDKPADHGPLFGEAAA